MTGPNELRSPKYTSKTLIHTLWAPRQLTLVLRGVVLMIGVIFLVQPKVYSHSVGVKETLSPRPNVDSTKGVLV